MKKTVIDYEITRSEDSDILPKLFLEKELEFKNNRTEIQIKKLKNNIIFEILSKDDVAMKAGTKSIQNTIKIYKEFLQFKDERRNTTKSSAAPNV